MSGINLLPWRETLRRKQQKIFWGGLAVSSLMTLLVLVVIDSQLDRLIQREQDQQLVLQNEIVLLDQNIQEIKQLEEKKTQLLSKIQLIQNIQTSRPEQVHLFVEIAQLIPDGVYLTKFSQTADKLIFEGKADSNASVSAFMRAIESSRCLSSPTLTVIKGQGDFSMTAKLGR
jgi:type IV pilus assembly protein PilN